MEPLTLKAWTLEDFQPFLKAEKEQSEARSAFTRKCDEARAFLDRVASRQMKDAAEIKSMLDELNKEENALRRQVREDTNRRAKARMTGQQPPEADIRAGARLAAIPDERAALEALRDVKEMTPEEREEWEALFSSLRDEETRSQNANSALFRIMSELEKYFDCERKAIAIAASGIKAETYQQDAWKLNSKPAADMSVDNYEPVNGDSSALRGRKVY